MKPISSKFKVFGSSLIKNSVWGVAANVIQVLFVSVFFVIVARKYTANEFAEFLISTTVYQLVAAFSSMGLGQWFIRQYIQETDKIGFTNKFLRTQILLGFAFYLVNILLAYFLYPNGQIRILCFLLGTNIIFDNFINAIRSLNIAEQKQIQTAQIFVIDGFLKLIIGCLLFINPFSAVVLSTLMIVGRMITLGLFLKLRSSSNIDLKRLWQAEIPIKDLKKIIVRNWQFIIIGSISIIYWRIANIIISKFLPLNNVADYEISFRIFSILQILPLVVSATIYPQFIKYFNHKEFHKLKSLYHHIFILYCLFSLICYVFIYSFAGFIIPAAFGDAYPGAVACLQQMFLTILVLPTVLLQANLIVSMGLEKMDMWFNTLSLVINVACCLVGLYFFKSLATVNYSIFLSFIFFHLFQDVLLIRRKIISFKHCLFYYLGMMSLVLVYHYMIENINPYLVFLIFSGFLIGSYFLLRIFKKEQHQPLTKFL